MDTVTAQLPPSNIASDEMQCDEVRSAMHAMLEVIRDIFTFLGKYALAPTRGEPFHKFMVDLRSLKESLEDTLTTRSSEVVDLKKRLERAANTWLTARKTTMFQADSVYQF